MHERAKIFSRKFIRNGIIGFVLSAILIHYAITKNEPLIPITLVLPVFAYACLCFGLKINKELKAKDGDVNFLAIAEQEISYKHYGIILRIFLISVTIIAVNHLSHHDYTAIMGMIAYGLWLYSQMTLLNNYFKV